MRINHDIYSFEDNLTLRRLIGWFLVVLLHLGIVYALVNGLGHKQVEIAKAPIEAKIIGELRDVPPRPPSPPPTAMPKLAPPPLPRIPLPEIKIERPPPKLETKTTAVFETPPPSVSAPTTALPEVSTPAKAELAEVRTAPVLDAAKSCRLPQYPSISRRNGEAGVVGLKFLISPEGKVIESMVEKSSGHRRLDEAALEALALCRFKPGTINGRPEASWAKMQYVWKLD